MQTLVVVFHVIVDVLIVGLVLLQQGKGADAGASFGAGASQTVFGSSGGGGSFLVRATTVAAVAFYATSLVLAIVARSESQLADATGLPIANEELLQQSILEQTQNSELPQADASDDALPQFEVTPQASGADVPQIQVVPQVSGDDDVPQIQVVPQASGADAPQIQVIPQNADGDASQIQLVPLAPDASQPQADDGLLLDDAAAPAGDDD